MSLTLTRGRVRGVRKGGVVKLGVLKHMVGDRLIIIHAKLLPELGEKVYDESLREVGYVSDIFGSVESFYVAVRRTTELSLKGNTFYIIKHKMREK